MKRTIIIMLHRAVRNQSSGRWHETFTVTVISAVR